MRAFWLGIAFAVLAGCAAPQQSMQAHDLATQRLAQAIVEQSAQAQSQEAQARAEWDDRGTGRTAGTPVDLLPLLNIGAPDSGEAAPQRIGGYTRFYVEGVLHERGVQPDGGTIDRRRYNLERRRWYQRWLIGRSLSRVLSIKVTLSQPDISGTTTLASATQQSSRTAGETWATEVNGRRMLTPYFRVDPNTTVSIETSLNASAAIQGEVSGSILNVMQRAATLLAPSSSLVTTLTEERLQDASDFVDQSISALFAETLAEKSTSDFGPPDWRADLVEISAYFPKANPADDQDLDHVGTWRVQIEPAIVSIFSSVPLCAGSGACDPQAQARTAFIGLAPYTVLNFRLSDDQTLGSVLRSDTAVAAALTALNGAASGERAQEARDLCNVVAAKVEALGFNRFDAAAAVWAVGESDMIAAGRTELQAAGTCEASRLFTSLRPAEPAREQEVEGAEAPESPESP